MLDEIKWFVILKEIIELLYYLAGVGLFGTLIVGLLQLNVLKKDLQIRNKRASVEKSLEFLKYYSDELLPLINKYYRELNKEIPKPKSVKHLINETFTLNPKELDKEIIAETIVREKMGVTQILNKLEFFSIAMLNGITDESLIFTPVARDFCETFEDQYVVIALHRSNGIAPYNNIVELYKVWNNKLEIEKLESEMDEKAGKMLSMLQNRKSVKRPIGL
jgi:hypothetical protein